jgi:hypothetical protein
MMVLKMTDSRYTAERCVPDKEVLHAQCVADVETRPLVHELQAQKELRASESRLQAITNSARDAIGRQTSR